MIQIKHYLLCDIRLMILYFLWLQYLFIVHYIPTFLIKCFSQTSVLHLTSDIIFSLTVTFTCCSLYSNLSYTNFSQTCVLHIAILFFDLSISCLLWLFIFICVLQLDFFPRIFLSLTITSLCLNLIPKIEVKTMVVIKALT